jgi:hypothetical protein
MAVNCKKCKYYYITWDAKFPYGCKAFGMKTKQLPSVEVYISSGKECIKFQKKEEPTVK